jgi:DNA-binding MarR family transcriptional regulator/N-acetylglutamate synthase-like GNAT family acetyltransferase
MASALDRRVAGVRRFNRFYTQRIGVLTDNFLKTPYTLAETRVLYELAQRDKTSPGDLATALEMDAGYLSRIVRRFEEQGLVIRTASPDDGRRATLALTDAGRDAFAPMNERQRDDVVALLKPLPAERQERVLRAMDEIASAFAPDEAKAEIILREPEAGDLGWVIERHGALYGAEYGLDVRMERDVAEIVASFVRNFQPGFERCWIAERSGVRCGSIFLVRENETTARIRLLLLEPSARGAGLGRRLVRACIDFARDAGYSNIVLWTHSVLTAARAIYQSEGFVMIDSHENTGWGPALTSETWELTL